MIYSSQQLAHILHASISGNEEREILTLSMDTRTILDGKSSLFFALHTESNDGHKYLQEAYDKGVRWFVVEKERTNGSDESAQNNQFFQNATFFLVESGLTALQALASDHRKSLHTPVCAITGSNGKTVIKEWLYQLLFDEKQILRSPRSYNSQIGVPLSLWLMQEQTELAFIEAGISKPDEMQRLNQTIAPTEVIIGHIGEAHLENFENKEELISEKVSLIRGAKHVYYRSDYGALTQIIQKKTERQSCFFWSDVDESATLFISTIDKLTFSTIIHGLFEGEKHSITIPFSDDASIENAIFCWLYLLCKGWFDKNVTQRFSLLETVAMRLEVRKGRNGNVLINDSYNSDFTSLSIALQQIDQQVKTNIQSSTVILSDLQQSPKHEKRLYKEIAQLIKRANINRFIGIGPLLLKHQERFSEVNAQFYHSTDEFLGHVAKEKFRNGVILIKGSRRFQFDRITDRLQAKAHQTVLDIDLSAMANNIRVYRSLVPESTKLMAMVKAFSYGTGSTEVAQFLQHQKIDYLAVAIADEGVELRRNGITVPIVVMNPEEHSFELMIHSNLEPNIYSLELLVRFSEVLKRNAVVKYPVHLKIDTGMKRLGFDSLEELEQATSMIKAGELMYLRSVFSHLSVSDETNQDAFTLEQITTFKHWVEQSCAKFDYEILRHILNTAGIERFPHHAMEMVRLGLGLYGVSCFKQSELQNVATLRTTISQIRIITPEQTVGYGRKGHREETGRIGILPIGYADGLNRRLSNGVGEVFVCGKRARFIGNICMDMCMIDISDIPEAREGVQVEVFGKNIPVSEIAEKLSTIPYEIMTTIGQRVNREYFSE